MSVQDYYPLYVAAGQQYGIDPALLMAQAHIENSTGDPKRVNPDTGATGVAQLIPSTSKSLGVSDATDPKEAIPAQAKLMRENLDRYGNTQDAVSAYHGGIDQSNWGQKTKDYTKKVMGKYQQMTSNDVNQDTQLSAALKNFKDDSSVAPPSSMAGDTSLAEALKNYKDEKAASQTNQKPIAQSYFDRMAQLRNQYGSSAENSLNQLANYNPETTPDEAIPKAFGNLALQGANFFVSPFTAIGTTEQGQKVGQDVGNLLTAAPTGIASGVKLLANPAPVYSKLANVIKTARDVLGAEVPTQMFASSNGILQKNAARAFDTSDLEAGINKKLVDLTGANDAGASHTVLDEDAFKDAKRNAGDQYEALHKEIGPVSLEKNYDAISNAFDSVDPSKQSLFSGIKKDLYSKLDDNAKISASDIKDLTGYKTKLDNYSRSPDPQINEPAKQIKSLLESSVLEAASPEQAQAYLALDNKYKLLKSMEPISNNLGAAPKISPKAISQAANKSYNKLTGASNPIEDFRYSLNTLYPNKAAVSDVLPEATGSSGGNLLSGQEIGFGLATGNPTAVALGAAQRAYPKIKNIISSAIVNSDWYRDQLLKNAIHLSAP